MSCTNEVKNIATWIEDSTTGNLKCSNCGQIRKDNETMPDANYNRCPRCGFKMNIDE